MFLGAGSVFDALVAYKARFLPVTVGSGEVSAVEVVCALRASINSL